MDPNTEPQFDLEEILREFSDKPPTPPEPPAKPSVTDDTVRLDHVRDAVAAASPLKTGDTAVFTPIREDVPVRVAPKLSDETAVFTPVTSGDPAAEPFSADWEPDYDEPIEDVPIPDPIPFRRSRLSELREKLISGPEKHYYILLEQGHFKLQLSMVLCLLVFLVCAASTATYALGAVAEDRMRLMVFVQFLGLLTSATLGCYRLMEGLGDLLRLRFTPNTLLVCTFVVCCIDGVLCLEELRVPVCAAFSLEMLMAMWSAYDRRTSEMGMMDTLRRATDLHSVVLSPDHHKGRPGILTGHGQVEHFMDHFNTPSGPQKVLDWYSLSTLLCAVAIGIVAGVRHGFSTGVEVCAGALLLGLPASSFLATCRPLAILEKRLHKLGTVLCGWQGVKALPRQAVFPLTDTDLFPQGAVKLNGTKFYGDRTPDQVVAYATSLIGHGGSALTGLFRDLLQSRGGRIHAVDEPHAYNGGLAGHIGDDHVLVGTLEFMQEMGVEMGSGTRVEQAVYCAIDSELCGVFAVTYQRSRASSAALRSLCGCRGLDPVVLSRDFMVGEGFLRSRFGISTRRMSFPDDQAREELLQREASEEDPVIALTIKEGLAPRAFAVTGARTLKSAMKAGVAIHMVGGILGLLIMAALAWVGGTDWLTPVNVLLYQLIWLIPGLLVTEWTRTL